MPRERGPTLVIANHQHDLDSMAIMAMLTLQGPWSKPIHTVSSRRMFERGFFAVRTPRLAPLLRRYDPTPLFLSLGPMPIENDLRRRSLRSVALSVRRRHPNVRLDDVIPQELRESLGFDAAVRLDGLASRRWFERAEAAIELRLLREPHRSEVRDETRRLLNEDLGRIERTLRAGGTFFLTPEGHYTLDGSLLRFRDAFTRLAPLADIWLAAISYDVLRGRRLSQLYRIVRPGRSDDVTSSLKAARPVTVSQLLASWLQSAEPVSFEAVAATSAVRRRLAELPQRLFIDPELRCAPEAVTRNALLRCQRLGIVRRAGNRYRMNERRRHPSFPGVSDIVAHQARFFAETLQAADALGAT
ncbi:MAG: hypothetical protein JO043_07685 [Candidatus Eremiobacteraeota bacterium]|nr:hypothetical protein [Candidatus Eremiobacteraeota bacterium]